MCQGGFYVVGRRCSRLSEWFFKSGFPRPCAEVVFMLSEGAVRAFGSGFSFSKAMCHGGFYVVGRRCSRLSEWFFKSGFPRPCAEVVFMLSEGAVRGFRNGFSKAVFQGRAPRCFLCCRKALFEAFGNGFSFSKAMRKALADVFFMLSEGAVRGFRKRFVVIQGHVPRWFLCCRKALFEAFGMVL